MSFVNLHGHSHYSLLDGYGSPREIVLRAKELGYPAVALTDHGVPYGLIELYQEAKSQGLKAILGCELYVAPRTRFDKDPKLDRSPYHLTILAKNNVGYENLLKLCTKAHLEGFYYKPRVDYGLLKTYGEGLIALSGCLAAHLPRLILAGKDDEARELIKQYIEIFGKENYFLELQDHPLIENQEIVNLKLREFAKEFDLGLILTFDSHYPRPEDSDVHDVLICIQTQTTVNDPNRMRYTGDYSLRDINELIDRYKDFPGAIENAVKIAEKCQVDFEFGKNLIPSFPTPQNEKPEIYLRQLCEEGLKARFSGKKIPADYLERLNFELNTVNKMGFDTYFLIVHDFVKYAKENGIVVGPGRGSAAGSIMAWSLNITDLDPIAYGLFFERFLNPERISMPDIDIDFADNRRDEVLNYVIEKYGKDNVAQIITFGTMAPKAAIRDAGRALGYAYAEVDTIAKSVPPAILGKYAPLVESLEDDPAMRDLYKNDSKARTILDYAKRLEGTVRHSGTHACAVVISENPLTDYTSLQFGAGGGGEIVTQYDADPLEHLGLLKMDFLGLKNLTVIQKTKEMVQQTQEIDIDVDNLPLDDEKTFQLLQRADTTGVFQLESPGMRRYLKQLKPTDFNDIVAMGALYRPGPMEWIPKYINGKHNPKSVEYLHESFKEVLQPTYGVAVYQEQILQIARDFAGFSLGEADILRKAVGKKIPTLLAEQREKFVKGALSQGHKEKFALEVFEKVIEPFAGYGFNKAHAVCYGLIAYQTAYLKAHYPVEFMTALLCSDASNTDRVVLEIKECNEMEIDVLPPSVNESFSEFTVTDKSKIRFGLLAIKGVGDGPIAEIIKVRESTGIFKSIEDFAKRVPDHILNKKLIQALAYSGAFDQFGDRNLIAQNYDEIAKFGKNAQESSSIGQTDIFGALGDEAHEAYNLKLRDVPKCTEMEKLHLEKNFLGMYVSGHPLRGLKPYIAKKGRLIGSLTTKDINKPVNVLGIVTNFKRIVTKTGGSMATFVIEDGSAKVNAIMFQKAMALYSQELAEDRVLGFSGRLDNRRNQYQFVCDVAKALSIETMTKNAKEAGIYDPDDKSDIAVRFLDAILDEIHEAEALKETSENPIVDTEIEDFEIEESNSEEPEELNSLLIEIPTGTSQSSLKKLKELLMNSKGDTPVELLLKDANQKIRLPFGIKTNEALMEEVSSLLTN